MGIALHLPAEADTAGSEPAVSLRLFARAAELAGVRHWRMPAENGVTAREAFLRLCHVFPPLVQMDGRLAFAVNAEYARPDTVLSPGDELTLIPPVSGGAGDVAGR